MSDTLGYFNSLGSSVSGAFSNVNSLSDAAGALGKLSSLFTGGTAVVLGTFSFNQWEIPERVEYGGKHAHTIHHKPGGGRTIVATGRDDGDISFRGRFVGSNATARAQQLDALRIAGKAMPLKVQGLSWTVFLADASFDYRRSNHVEYSLKLVFLQPPPAARGATSLLGAINADIKSAIGVDVASALGSVQSVIGQAGPLLNGLSAISPALGNRLSGILGQASSVSGGLLSAANGNMAALGTVAGALTGSAQAANLVGSLAGLAPTIATSSAAGAFLDRARNNAGSAAGTGSTAGNAVSQASDGSLAQTTSAPGTALPGTAPPVITVPNGLTGVDALNYARNNGGLPSGPVTIKNDNMTLDVGAEYQVSSL